jgi:hypothetical protein
MLPLVIVFQKNPWYSKKRKKEKRKRTNVPLRNKKRFRSPSSPQILQVSKRGI